MRDILFRAKLKDTNYWAEGFYCSMRETTYCCEEDYKRHGCYIYLCIVYFNNCRVSTARQHWNIAQSVRAAGL